MKQISSNHTETKKQYTVNPKIQHLHVEKTDLREYHQLFPEKFLSGIGHYWPDRADHFCDMVYHQRN